MAKQFDLCLYCVFAPNVRKFKVNMVPLVYRPLNYLELKENDTLSGRGAGGGEEKLWQIYFASILKKDLF